MTAGVWGPLRPAPARSVAEKGRRLRPGGGPNAALRPARKGFHLCKRSGKKSEENILWHLKSIGNSISVSLKCSFIGSQPSPFGLRRLWPGYITRAESQPRGAAGPRVKASYLGVLRGETLPERLSRHLRTCQHQPPLSEGAASGGGVPRSPQAGRPDTRPAPQHVRNLGNRAPLGAAGAREPGTRGRSSLVEGSGPLPPASLL